MSSVSTAWEIQRAAIYLGRRGVKVVGLALLKAFSMGKSDRKHVNEVFNIAIGHQSTRPDHCQTCRNIFSKVRANIHLLEVCPTIIVLWWLQLFATEHCARTARSHWGSMKQIRQIISVYVTISTAKVVNSGRRGSPWLGDTLYVAMESVNRRTLQHLAHCGHIHGRML